MCMEIWNRISSISSQLPCSLTLIKLSSWMPLFKLCQTPIMKSNTLWPKLASTLWRFTLPSLCYTLMSHICRSRVQIRGPTLQTRFWRDKRLQMPLLASSRNSQWPYSMMETTVWNQVEIRFNLTFSQIWHRLKSQTTRMALIPMST
jgi:hypothetical protein